MAQTVSGVYLFSTFVSPMAVTVTAESLVTARFSYTKGSALKHAVESVDIVTVILSDSNNHKESIL